jgi:hypothetical protein
MLTVVYRVTYRDVVFHGVCLIPETALSPSPTVSYRIRRSCGARVGGWSQCRRVITGTVRRSSVSIAAATRGWRTILARSLVMPRTSSGNNF